MIACVILVNLPDSVGGKLPGTLSDRAVEE